MNQWKASSTHRLWNRYWDDLCHLCGWLIWDCKCPGGMKHEKDRSL